jgi:hypothetical protein
MHSQVFCYRSSTGGQHNNTGGGQFNACGQPVCPYCAVKWGGEVIWLRRGLARWHGLVVRLQGFRVDQQTDALASASGYQQTKTKRRVVKRFGQLQQCFSWFGLEGWSSSLDNFSSVSVGLAISVISVNGWHELFELHSYRCNID